MSEEVIERIAQVTKQLYKLNLVSIILCFVMWISSLYYAVSMGLKYGLTFQVTTIVGNVERSITSNTLFNLAMSGMFTWMMITSVLSAVYLWGMANAKEKKTK
jgi:hypothetical protein